MTPIDHALLKVHSHSQDIADAAHVAFWTDGRDRDFHLEELARRRKSLEAALAALDAAMTPQTQPEEAANG